MLLIQRHSVGKLQSCRLVYIFLCLHLFIVTSFVEAQQTENNTLHLLEARLKQYAMARQQVDLFLHLDKNIYTPQENIWFTAYVLNNEPIESQHTLHTLLFEEASKKIVAAENFVLEDGMAGGAIFLPDSIPAGEYRLLAYTNSFLTHPGQLIFQQPISVKTADTSYFRLTMLPENNNNDTVRFGYKILTNYGGLASGGSFDYTLYADSTRLMRGTKLIDPFGEVKLAVTKRQLLGKKVRIEAMVSRQKEKQEFMATVPLFQHTAFIKLYPEGGNLLHNSRCYMGIEIKNGAGAAVASKGQLLEDGMPVTSFITDRLGVGIIEWTPQNEKNYTLQLEDTALQLLYNFPSVSPVGHALHVPAAVIKDSVIITEITAPAGDTCHLIAHNYRTIFFAGSIVLKNNRSRLQIPAKGMSGGVVTLTLFSKTGVPKAERAIYIDRSESLRVEMVTDSIVYHQRSRVQMKIKVTNSQGLPVKSFFSFACGLTSRQDMDKMVDIVRYQQFDRFLPVRTVLPESRYLGKPENIERILLTRFWTKYKWSTIDTARPFMVKEEPACQEGIVYFNGKQVSKPVQLMLLGGAKVYTFTTDSTGYFALYPRMLKINAGERATILLPGDKSRSRNYSIKLFNRCASFDTTLATADYPEVAYKQAELTRGEQQYLRNAMKTVVVNAKKEEDELFSSYKALQNTSCNDWICMYNYLNCPVHPAGTPPVKGKEYYIRMGAKWTTVIYKGCSLEEEETIGSFIEAVNGISYPKEFYVADYEKFNPAFPEIASTVYWSYKILTNDQGEAVINFSTNDLTGRFKCTLQGYSDQGVLSKTTSFRVIE